MPKKRTRRTPKGPSAANSRRRPPSDETIPNEGLELLDELDGLLKDAHPWSLLGYASAMLAALEQRHQHPFAPAEPAGSLEIPPLPELLDSFVDAGPAPAALATVIARLHDDDLLRARVSRSVGPRPASWPQWVDQLDAVEVVAAVEMADVLRDSDNVVVHVRVAGHDLTMVVLVDFNLGTVVKDAFVLPEAMGSFTELWSENADPAAAKVGPVSTADARARIEDAIQTGTMTWPPLESETWPASRPLLEWLLRRLPTGGTPYVRPEWSDRDLRALTERFLASPGSASPNRPEDASIVGDLLWYRTDYGSGDPMRWSPAAVEILLQDWYPRKVVADRDYLHRMPAVLRAFVAFAHAEVGLGVAQTTPTLAAVDELESDYRSRVDQPSSGGPADLLAALRLTERPESRQFRLQILTDHAGGPESLAGLDDQPLPDEPFDDTLVPSELRIAVTEVLTRCDACCDELFDIEHRTAVRRLLHDVVLATPRAFGGRANPDTAAAALCWLIARANDDPDGADVIPTRDLLAHFGLSATPTSRITTMRRAVGADSRLSPGSLGSARYLTSRQRRQLIEARDS